jgi:hypothetical protein
VIARLLTIRVRMALALLVLGAAIAFVLVPLVGVALGAGGSGSWQHLWCSPGALTSAAHAVGRSGFAHALLAAVEIHWPHFLPIVVGLFTLRYLWRADARYRAERARTLAAPPS